MTNLFAKSVIKLTKLVIPELLTSKSSIHWSFITLLTGSNSGHTLIKWPHSRGFSMPPSSHFLNTSKTKPQKDLKFGVGKVKISFIVSRTSKSTNSSSIPGTSRYSWTGNHPLTPFHLMLPDLPPDTIDNLAARLKVCNGSSRFLPLQG